MLKSEETNKSRADLSSEYDIREKIESHLNETKMLNISLTAREEQIASLTMKLKEQELESFKQEEVINCLNEKVVEMDKRIRAMATQLVEIGQDRR